MKTNKKKLLRSKVGARSTVNLNTKVQENGIIGHTSRPRLDNGLDFVFFEEVQHKSSPFLFCFDKAVEFFKYRKFLFAANMFQKALEIDKTNIYAISNLAVSLFKLQNLPEAVKTLHQIIKLDKSQECSYYNIALGYVLFGKYNEAQLCLQSAESNLPALSVKVLQLRQFIDKIVPNRSKSPFISIKPRDNPKLAISKSLIFSQRVIEDLNSSNLSNISVSDGSSLTLFDDFTEKMNSKMIKLKEKVSRTMKKLETKKIVPGNRLETKYVTEEELRFINKEFSKEVYNKDYGKIDRVLSKLSFFSEFPLETRQMIYSISSIKEYNTNDSVFRQGETGDSMYVVIKGAVSVGRLGPEFGNMNIVVNTIYDGNQFGEIALLNAIDSATYSKERSFSCIVSELTTLLCIPKDTLSQIILQKNKNDLDEKIDLLSKTLFFKGFAKNQLLPLALNLKIQTYKLNDLILAKGQVPQGLYIIFEGFVDLVNEETIPQDPEIATSRPQSKLSPMYFSRNPPISRSKSPPLPKPQQKEKLLISSLQKSEHFGSRSLKNLFSTFRTVEPAKFNVIAQSSTVEILLITNFHLQFIDQDMFIQMKAVIDKTNDPDCPKGLNENDLKKLTHDWSKYKFHLLNGIYKSNSLTRNK